MNSIHYAIASIVDANTGYTLTRETSHAPDYRLAQQHGREIRSKTIIALFAQMKSALTAGLDKMKQAAKNRRQTESILNLSPHLLKDIGLHREDVARLKDGLIDMENLESTRRQASSEAIRNCGRVTRLNAGTRRLKAANQTSLSQANCA